MGRKRIVEVGMKVNRLIIIKEVQSTSGHTRILCKCDCGNEIEIRLSALLCEKTKSCGCLAKEQLQLIQKENLKHYVYDENGLVKSEYNTYRHIKARCYNPNNRKYKDYGARGIKVCDRWLDSYLNFIEDVGLKPSKEHTLDRIKVNGDYEPGNCRWALPVVQSNNQRRNIFLELDGLQISQAQLAKLLNIGAKSVEFQRKKGLTAQQIIDKYKKPNHVIEFDVFDKKIFAKN